MLACVEIFKPRVLQLTLRYFVPRAPLQTRQLTIICFIACNHTVVLNINMTVIT